MGDLVVSSRNTSVLSLARKTTARDDLVSPPFSLSTSLSLSSVVVVDVATLGSNALDTTGDGYHHGGAASHKCLRV